MISSIHTITDLYASNLEEVCIRLDAVQVGKNLLNKLYKEDIILLRQLTKPCTGIKEIVMHNVRLANREYTTLRYYPEKMYVVFSRNKTKIFYINNTSDTCYIVIKCFESIYEHLNIYLTESIQMFYKDRMKVVSNKSNCFFIVKE